MVKIKEGDEKRGSLKEGIKNALISISLFRFAVFLIFLKLIDVASTYYALSHLDAMELNPIVRYMIENIGLAPAMIILFGVYSAIICRIYYAPHRTRLEKSMIFIAIMILMCVVDLNNIGWLLTK